MIKMFNEAYSGPESETATFQVTGVELGTLNKPQRPLASTCPWFLGSQLTASGLAGD